MEMEGWWTVGGREVVRVVVCRAGLEVSVGAAC